MNKEREALDFVYSELSENIDTLYQYFRKKKGLEDTHDIERQLDILTDKKYISTTYIADIMLITDYYQRGMTAMYESSLQNFKNRIQFFLER